VAGDSIHDLNNDPVWKHVLSSMMGRSLGTLEMVSHPVSGKQVFKGPVKGQYFETPMEAAAWLQASGFKKREVIDTLPGRPVRALSPTGSYDYDELRQVSRDIRGVPGYQDVSIVREAYGVRTGATAAQAEHFVRGGKTYGFAIPDDETTTVLRMFRGEDELTQQEIREAFKAAGYNFNPSDEASFVKLMKRLKVLGNPEAMHAALDSPLRVGVFADDNPLALQMGGVRSLLTDAKVAERNASGMSIMNPQVLMDMADKMEASAKADEAALAGLSPVELRLAKKNIAATKAEASKLRAIAQKGGRLQDFRVTGLSIADPQFQHLQDAMIKGDVNVPALGGEWNEWVGRASPLFGVGPVDPNSLDIITVQSNLTGQYGRGNLPTHISLKPVHMSGGVNADAQTMAAYGQQVYGGPNYAGVIGESTAWYESQLEHMATTGELPAGYETSLRKLLGVSGYDPNAPDDIKDIMRGFGIIDDASLMNQQSRAQRILTMQRMGLNTATHEPMFREVAEGMRESLLGGAKHEGQLYGHVPVSARMHMQGDIWGYLATGQHVAEGEFSVDPRFGLTYNGEDFVRQLYEAHGGADFDDSLASMLRLDEATGELVGVNIRNPMASGEVAVARPTRQSVLELARMSTAEPGQNTALQQSLANVGFYDIHPRVAQQRRSYEARIDANEAIMRDPKRKANEIVAAQKENDALRNVLLPQVSQQISDIESAAYDVIKANVPRLSADDIDLLRSAHVPAGMELLNPGNYESYVNAQIAKFGSMLSSKDTPDNVIALFGGPVALDPYELSDWSQRLVRERGSGVLGNYSLVREMADEYAKQVEDAGQTMASPLKYLIQEAVIDPLTKGFSESYGSLTPQGIEAIALAMMQDMVETARITGVKLDPLRLEHRFNPRMRALIPQMLANVDPDASMDDIIMTAEEAANAPFGRAMKLQRQADEHREYLMRKYTENMDLQRAIKRTAFDQQALADARAMAESYHNARAAVEAGGVGIPNEIQEMMLGMVGEDTSSDMFKNARAREAVQRTFSEFLEGGSMGSRATQAMGAFIQQYQGSSAFSAVQEGTLARAQAVARASFDYRNASSSLGESDFYTAEHVRVARDVMGEASTITEDFLKSGASRFTELPGEKRAGAMAAAYDIADAVKNGVMNGKGFARGPQAMSAMEHLKGFADLPGVRKAGLAVGAVVLASTIYRGVKDRTNHDMEGPPLLPGGSAYEDYYDRPTETMDQYHPPQGGGVKYKINTRGGDHRGFRKSAERYTGSQSTGSTYSSRNYDQSGMPSALNGAF